jgi:ATP-dependent Lon protease
MHKHKDEIGVVNGIAWTQAGGEVLTIEATTMEGKGNIMLTGQLGDVMKESAHAALSYARSNAKNLGITAPIDDKHDIHIHVPSGAIPKDGPSAGVAIGVAVISLLSGKPARWDVAMTGEISLRGSILPIGGVKEKILAAKRDGISTIILPRKNKGDLSELTKEEKAGLKFILADKMNTALKAALR